MSQVDPDLRQSALPSRSAHPTWLLRFREPVSAERLREAESSGREAPEPRHVGSLKLAPSGKLDMDIRSAALQGLLSLNVFDAMEAERWILGDPDSIDLLEAACVAATEGRFTVERVRVDQDDEALMEAAYGSASDAAQWGGPVAPWAPLPLRMARQFIMGTPDAQIEINFPTVYEEDRTAKIADLTVAESQKVISHRRYAEQVAKELGIAQYDYDEEQQDIKLHPSPAAAMPGLGVGPGGEPGFPRGGGVGDPAASAGLHNRVRATLQGQAPEPPAGPGHRPGMGAPERAAFRNDQSLEAAAASHAKTVEVLGEFFMRGMQEIVESVRAAAAPTPVAEVVATPSPEIHVHEAEPSPVIIPAPVVHVHAPPAGPRPARRIIWKDGRPVGFEDVPPEAAPPADTPTT